MSYQQQLERIKNDTGFIAALDQSGGSTPKALRMYGVEESEYSNDDEMFAKVHEMRTRIITSDSFDNKRVLGAILFENTMDSMIDGKPTANYLWEEKGIVPFLKVDKGLAEQREGVQAMKPMPDLAGLLEKAKHYPIFGTKMRSVIHEPVQESIETLVQQQFDVAKQILSEGFMPIVEPEVNIESNNKLACELLLKEELIRNLDRLDDDHQVILKLTLPEEAGFYEAVINHPRVLRVVALSGGYSRDESCQRLQDNKGIIASFSRAFTEGLAKSQTDKEFDEMMDASIEKIYNASKS